MKITAIFLVTMLLSASLAFAAQDNKTQNVNNTQRGSGLEEAIKHVSEFVAQKLTYMRELFQNGTRGIGQMLSDWIHNFFKPVASSNQTLNKT